MNETGIWNSLFIYLKGSLESFQSFRISKESLLKLQTFKIEIKYKDLSYRSLLCAKMKLKVFKII